MKKILGTGLNGLVGSRIVELLGSKYEFENISRATGVDITNAGQVLQKILSSSSDLVIHLAAKTNVDSCEDERNLGNESEAWKINVIGTQNVADACRKSNKKLMYVSTDFVFDGKISENAFYTELDTPNPVNWYAQTKYEGEKLVQELTIPWIIVRPAYPYRADFTKGDFFRAIKNRLAAGQPIKGVRDHIFSPTFIDDFAYALDVIIEQNGSGIYHTVGEEYLSPYDAAQIIAEEFGYDKNLISSTTRAEYFKDKASRPFRLALKNDRINAFGVHVRGFREGLQKIKYQYTQ